MLSLVENRITINLIGKTMSYTYGFVEKQTNQQSPFKYFGNIKATFYKGNIGFKEIKSRFSDGAPNFDIFDQEGVIFGKAWVKKPKSDKPHFFSIQVDSPNFEKPINLTGFQDKENSNRLNIVWSRAESSTTPPTLSQNAKTENGAEGDEATF